MCGVQCIELCVHCTLYTVHFTLYTLQVNPWQWAVSLSHSKVPRVHCTLYNAHCTVYSVSHVQCTAFPGARFLGKCTVHTVSRETFRKLIWHVWSFYSVLISDLVLFPEFLCICPHPQGIFPYNSMWGTPFCIWVSISSGGWELGVWYLCNSININTFYGTISPCTLYTVYNVHCMLYALYTVYCTTFTKASPDQSPSLVILTGIAPRTYPALFARFTVHPV